MVGIYSRPKWKDGGDHSILFLCSPLSIVIAPDLIETSECEYFSLNTLPTDLWPPHREMISDGLSLSDHVFLKTQKYSWKFGKDISWNEAVRLFKESGLSGIDFANKYIL